ncbi:MAG TPA: iron-containing redox enzyme family protein [Myxococcaceae bacterium]|nr:iron-containing redox enzyme family protein [Myxococcaceae bacterium]
MTTTALEQALQAALAPRDLLTHPFYQAWSAGELRAEDLARYAEQYRFQVQALPELLRRARALSGDAETRAELSRNLDDEEGRTGVAHARLWEAFGSAVGAAAEAPPLPETRASAEALTGLVGEDEVTALAALWAYEIQTARVAETKETGLRSYGVDSPAALRFFRLHGELDVHHARGLLQSLERAVARGASVEAAKAAVERSSRAQWTFLDGAERLRQARLAAA